MPPRRASASSLGVPLANRWLAGQHSALARLADRLGATPSQLALAWLLKRSPVMLPSRNSRHTCDAPRRQRRAAEIELSDSDFDATLSAAA